ncbi:cache domain-containing sensor histidine kinase [Evansella cellulosilytica]|uniref:Integral membrane sensor signal transduction histidine kinase n=1 Tax=Evansella cellulosilytica (strain ATCC 21833 / DSM 2522 / FERM P-1141 / JCM 9156 / N-4) TaxID=649639 RepID=E6U0G9_EVAC2|nr:sensor histidine kinase [Evansella cellulosilytica]ADU31414.1 integral membrane sensor signal transduction histidine kinase [Evansella cellulosilytica DSM 2522]
MEKWIPLQNWSLKWKSVIMFLLLVITPTMTIGIMVYYQTNEILKRQVIDTASRNLIHVESNFLNVQEEIEDISGYVIYSNEFRDFMTLTTHDDNYNEIYKNQNQIKGFITFHLTNKPYFHSMVVEGVNDNYLEFGDLVQGDETEWIEKAVGNEGLFIWSSPYTMERRIWSNDEVSVISLFRVINHLYDIKRPVGMVTIRLDERELYDYVTNGFSDNTHETFVIKKDGEVLLHEEPSYVGARYRDENFVKQLTTSNEDVFSYELDGEVYYAVKQKIEDRELFLVSMVKEEYILAELAGIRLTMKIMIGMGVFIGVLAVFISILMIIRPILELTNETKKLEDGDFQANVKIRSHDEIGKLGIRFNKMVKQIQRLIETKYKLEIENKESELQALQSQINPHFLYNTLDMIRWTARLENAAETGKSIEDLSRLFRINLNNGKLWIQLKDEMKYVHSYIELQKKRLPGKTNVLIVMESGIENALVMKIILQPLAENSIKHGFKNNGNSKRVYIRAYRNGDGINIDVIDNGTGLEVRKTNEKLSRKHEDESGFGLKNINDRIVNAFGSDYGLKLIEPANRQGTHVQLFIPFICSEEDLKKILKREDK